MLLALVLYCIFDYTVYIVGIQSKIVPIGPVLILLAKREFTEKTDKPNNKCEILMAYPLVFLTQVSHVPKPLHFALDVTYVFMSVIIAIDQFSTELLFFRYCHWLHPHPRRQPADNACLLGLLVLDLICVAFMIFLVLHIHINNFRNISLELSLEFKLK